MTHSFFAIMGGFVVDHSLHSTERASLTGKAILHTARTENTLLDIPRSSIDDRSKCDGLGKMLVCVQAGYIILQIVGRLESGLAVTLLEINTLGHILCALLLYTFWFNKPLDVKEPMVLTPRWAVPLDAIWSMRNRIFESYRTRDRRDGQVKEREVFDHFRYETLRRKKSSVQRPNKAETGFSAKVVRNLTHNCRLCGHGRSGKQGTKVDCSSTLAIEIWVCPMCNSRNSIDDATNLISANPDPGELSIQHCHICWKRKAPQYTGRAEYTFYSSPDAGSCSAGNTSNQLLARADSPGLLTPSQVPIIRRTPSMYEIGTWETTDLVLVWHDIDESFDDDAVRRELRDCSIWSSISRIYCVDTGLRDACYFKSAPAIFSDTLNCRVVVNTAATDRICGVQLDLPGLRRWKAAYEAACDSAVTKDTFEEAALKRIERGAPARAGDGLGVYNALQYWEEDKEKNQFLRHGISNWPSGAGYLEPPRDWIPQAAFALVTSCYGGLHIAAWNFSFPSKNEQILWRVSALLIAGAFFLVILFVLFAWAVSLDDWPEDYYDGVRFLIGIAGGGLLAAYCLARLFIVLEAFISLRRLPLSAYDTPRWTTLLPHL
jgi:hypothetical protein